LFLDDWPAGVVQPGLPYLVFQLARLVVLPQLVHVCLPVDLLVRVGVLAVGMVLVELLPDLLGEFQVDAFLVDLLGRQRGLARAHKALRRFVQAGNIQRRRVKRHHVVRTLGQLLDKLAQRQDVVKRLAGQLQVDKHTKQVGHPRRLALFQRDFQAVVVGVRYKRRRDPAPDELYLDVHVGARHLVGSGRQVDDFDLALAHNHRQLVGAEVVGVANHVSTSSFLDKQRLGQQVAEVARHLGWLVDLDRKTGHLHVGFVLCIHL